MTVFEQLTEETESKKTTERKDATAREVCGHLRRRAECNFKLELEPREVLAQERVTFLYEYNT